MAITIGSITNIPYSVGAVRIGVPVVNGNHHRYNPNGSALVTLTDNPIGGAGVTMHRLGSTDVAAGPGGDSIYLHFFNDQITSVSLSYPPPAGVDFFFTANMSACKLYIDREVGGSTLVVYHANTTGNAPGVGALSDVQTAAATATMDTLHNAAQNNYIFPNGLINVAEFDKATYFARAADKERHKRSRFLGRRHNQVGIAGAKFTGACTIVGFPDLNLQRWRLYYQTWGDVAYVRPSGLHHILAGALTFHWKYLYKLSNEGKKHSVGHAQMNVVEAGVIY